MGGGVGAARIGTSCLFRERSRDRARLRPGKSRNRRDPGRRVADRLGAPSAGSGSTHHPDYPAAQAAYERSLAIRRAVGHQLGAGFLIQLMGMLAHRQRDFASARALYLESLETFRDINSHWQMSQTVALFASLAAMQQQPERAARLVGATETAIKWSRTQPIPLTEELFREGCDLAVQELGEARFVTGVAQGRAMSLDEALAEARAVEVTPSAQAHATPASRYPAGF